MVATIVVDLGYGDSGKGTTVDYLTKELGAKTIVKFSGGPQNAHNVITEGKHHCFSQFGSGSLQPDVQTYISKYCYVDPISMLNEYDSLVELKDDVPAFYVDSDCLIVTPYHSAMNRIKELNRGANRHGSCGRGINETVAYAEEHDAPQVGTLAWSSGLLKKLTDLQTYARSFMGSNCPEEVYNLTEVKPSDLVEAYQWLIPYVWWSHDISELLQGEVIFEGSQGVLLDEWHGFYPYVTRSHTTATNARNILWDYRGEVKTIGVMRSYMTRHGDGPFPTEDSMHMIEPHNGTGIWQGNFRVGHLDLMALKLAKHVTGHLDELMVTWMDAFESPWLVATSYGAWEDWEWVSLYNIRDIKNYHDSEIRTREVTRCIPNYSEVFGQNALLRVIEEELETPVTIVSYGPDRNDKVRLSR